MTLYVHVAMFYQPINEIIIFVFVCPIIYIPDCFQILGQKSCTGIHCKSNFQHLLFTFWRLPMPMLHNRLLWHTYLCCHNPRLC